MSIKSETSRICVFSPAFYLRPEKRPGIERLKYSAQKFGIDIHLIGLGEQWKGFYQCKILALRDFLRDNVIGKYDYTLMVDANDCMFQQPLSVLIDKYKEKGHDIIIAGERNLFPRWLGKCYEDSGRKHVQRGLAYPNSGCVLSTPEKYLNTLEHLILIRKEYSEYARESDKTHPTSIYEDRFEDDKVIPGTDQALWGMASILKLHDLDIYIDREQELFGCFAGYNNEDVNFKNGKVYTERGRAPTVLHFNSKANRYFAYPVARWLFPEKYGKPKASRLKWFSMEDDIVTLRVIILRNIPHEYEYDFGRINELRFRETLNDIDPRIGETGYLEILNSKESCVYMLRGLQIASPLQNVIDRFERPLRVNTVVVIDKQGNFTCSSKRQVIINLENKLRDSNFAEEVLARLERIKYNELE